MKKKLLIIGAVIGILLIGFLFLFPSFNSSINKKLNNDSQLKKITQEELEKSFNEVIAKYQQILDYPSDMIDILNLKVNYGDGCLLRNDEESCSLFYIYQDLNNDDINELIIGTGRDKSYIMINDIFYYDGTTAKRLFGDWEKDGFWYRNMVSILENGKFVVTGYSGASSGITSYYGNVKSPKDDAENWNDFGLILEYKFENEQKSYIKYDENQNEQAVSEKEYTKLIENFNNDIDFKKWNWKKLDKNPNIIINDKYKVTDYFYLTDKDKFVKGRLTDNGYTLQLNFTAYELNVSHSTLFNEVSDFSVDVTYCIDDRSKCNRNINEYEYPMKYMKEKNDLRNPYEWHFVISTANMIFYDTNNDGYVDTSSERAYIVAPIDEYEKRFGKLID